MTQYNWGMLVTLLTVAVLFYAGPSLLSVIYLWWRGRKGKTPLKNDGITLSDHPESEPVVILPPRSPAKRQKKSGKRAA